MLSGERVAAAVLLVLPVLLAGCGSAPRRPAVKCPQVVNYTDAQLDAIQRSINRLAKTDPLRGAMQDYEQLRDDARYCNNLLQEQ